MYYDIILNMLKDTGIPPMQFREKNVFEGASVFRIKSHKDNTPPWD